MLVVLNDEIYNMGRYDKITRINNVNNGEKAGYGIAFLREHEEIHYSKFDSEAERNSQWGRLTRSVNNWYS